MIEKGTIENLLEEYIESNGLKLIDVTVNKANNIKIFFDTPGRYVTIDDCSALSRYIEGKMDREKEDYSLMVSSAGIDKSNIK